MQALWEKVRSLRQQLQRSPSLLVAYSGGVDSAFLLHSAFSILGNRVHGIVANSPSLPREELNEALELAKARGWPVEIIATQELENPSYTANPVNRCYFCKQDLFTRMAAYAQENRFAALAYGENADDALEFRPGQKAANEFAVLAPLREAGLTKVEIRQLSREAQLPTASKVAQPCLSSRLPTGQVVTKEALQQIEEGEKILKRAGFHIFRLRHLGARAKIQVALDELPHLQGAETNKKISAALLALGFEEVEFDPQGYQGASLR